MRLQKLLTFAGSNPINIVTGLNGTQMANYGRLAPVWCRSVLIQVQPASTGPVYVMDGIYGAQADHVSPRIPSARGATQGDLTATLVPGGAYQDQYALDNQQGGINASVIWVDDATMGDTVIVSYDVIESHL